MSEHKTESTSSPTGYTPTVGTTERRFAGVRVPSGIKLRFLIIGLAIVAAIIVGLTVWHSHHTSQATGPVPKQVSNKTYATRQVAKLKANPPAGNAAAADRAQYLSVLIETQYDAGDYPGVISSYQELIKLDPGTALTDDAPYTVAALAYSKQGDKPSAMAAVDKAQAVDQKIPDATQRARFLQDLQSFREGL